MKHLPSHSEQEPIYRNVAIFPAWPYANGPRHIGHGVSLLGADVLARYHRGVGNHVLMASGTDEHGTPNDIAASNAGVDNLTYVTRMNDVIRHDFELFGMSFDQFTRTSTPQHAEVAQEIFTELVSNGYLTKGTMLGSFDSVTGESLPDRYVEGQCPHCKHGARGDQCEECGNMLDPQDLIAPISKLTQNPVDFRDTEHMFLRLDLLAEEIRTWLASHQGLRPNAVKMSLEMTNDLRPRAVTRDMDWGVPLPAGLDLEGADEKVIYVWFEAVIGYLSASIQWAEEQGQPEAWKQWWQNSQASHYYAMGKDNIPFHSIIWPGILMGINHSHQEHPYNLPDYIASTEYLTMGDGKFSSSRGNVLYLRDMLALVGQDALRYYFIAAGPERHDKAFSFEEMIARNNDELIANWGNLVNRTLNVAFKNLGDSGLAEVSLEELQPQDLELLSQVSNGFEEVGLLVQEAQLKRGLDTAMKKSALVNKYLFEEEPWRKFSGDPQEVERAKQIMYTALSAIFNVSTLLSPFIPQSSAKVQAMLGSTKNIYGIPEHRQTTSDGFDFTYLTGDYAESRGIWGYQPLNSIDRFSKPSPLFRKLDLEALLAEFEAYLVDQSIGKVALRDLVQ